jgi:hypothetical protein
MHFDSPHQRIAYLPAPEEVSVRAILTMSEGEPGRVSALRLDMSDLRGWTPPDIRCWDGASVTVFSPSGNRFPPGQWVFSVNPSGGAAIRFACTVPPDILDIGRCSPSGDAPPGATLAAMATAIDLHVPGQASEITIGVERDGVLIGRRTLHPKYMTVTCTTASDIITLR